MSNGISELLGKVLESVTVNEDNDRIDFVTTDGGIYSMFHCQDCCESVTINDICGDLADLIGSPVLVAEAASNEHLSALIPPSPERTMQILKEGIEDEYSADSQTWTFYKIDTAKGGVTIRWYGESNGYYSEDVSFERIDDAN